MCSLLDEELIRQFEKVNDLIGNKFAFLEKELGHLYGGKSYLVMLKLLYIYSFCIGNNVNWRHIKCGGYLKDSHLDGNTLDGDQMKDLLSDLK